MENNEKLLIIGGKDNVFAKNFKKMKIDFDSLDLDEFWKSTENYEIILMVNIAAKKGEEIKERNPGSRVFLVSGGSKAFQPMVTAIHGYGENNHSYHYYKNWEALIQLINSEIEKPKKLFISDEIDTNNGFYNLTTEDVFPDCPDKMEEERKNIFYSLVALSNDYLEWYMEWVEWVMSKEFFCNFDYFGKNKKKIKQLIVPYDEQEYKHYGLEVLSVEDAVIFFGSEKKYPAIITAINEEEIFFHLHEAISRAEASDIAYFKKEINTQIAMTQKYVLERIIGDGDYIHAESLITATLAGEINNDPYIGDIKRVYLDNNEKKILRDESQCEALFVCFDSSLITPIVGPPGSGKTFVTAIAVKQYFIHGHNILLVSHSNQGLDNLLSEVVKHVDKKYHELIFRMGNNFDVVNSKIAHFHRNRRFNSDEECNICSRPEESELNAILDFNNRGSGVIIACTLNSLLSDNVLSQLLKEKKLKIGLSVIDEATRGFMYEMLPVLEITEKKLIMVGDHRQLGNMDIPRSVELVLKESRYSEEMIDIFKKGIFTAYLERGLLREKTLKINRRSLPNITQIINAFYSDQLISGRFENNNPGTVIFIDTSNAQDNQEKQKGTSWYNKREANLAIKELLKLLKKDDKYDSTGIITPYQAQIRLLLEKARKPLLFDLKIDREKMEKIIFPNINTVDTFQGSERENIIISFVCSNDQANIRFNKDQRRINVAMSRAKNCLVIIINAETYLNSDAPSETKEAIKRAMQIAKENGRYRKVV